VGAQILEGVNILNHLDTLPRAALVAKDVLLSGAIVGHLHTLDRHGVGALGVVGGATGPLAGAFGQARIAAGPDADREAHGCLGIEAAVVGVFRNKAAHQATIDVKVEKFLGPDAGVVVVDVLEAADGVVASVPEVGLALSKIVRGGVRVVAAHEFPVDLIEVVAEEHDGADDADAGGRLHPDLGAAEENVELGAERGAVALLVDGKVSAAAVVRGAAHRLLPHGGLGLGGEVEADVGSEGGVGWTCNVHGVAVGRDLGGDMVKEGRGNEERSRRGEGPWEHHGPRNVCACWRAGCWCRCLVSKLHIVVLVDE
jgi:hypothetical protein